MKNNVVYVDFTSRKVLRSNNGFSFKAFKKHMTYVFSSLTNRFNGGPSCKRIPKKRYFS